MPGSRMNILARLFWLPFNDRIVDDAVVPGLAKSLGSIVKARGLSHIQLPDELLDDLLAEAIERARTNEPDGHPRYRGLWQRIEEIAAVASDFYKGHASSDAAVVAILKKYEVTTSDPNLEL